TPQMKATCHEHCGFGTYLFQNERKEILPITRFVDIEGLFGMLEDMTDDLRNGGRTAKAVALLKLARKFPKMVDSSKAPPQLKLRRLLINVLSNGTASSVVPFHRKALFLGAMHFMDPYNFDIERVKRCSIHYALPNGKIIPFCSYNIIHRSAYEKEAGVPLDEWKAPNPDKD
ncbi:MAG TPA: radical SAM protein, partial [Candidatus Methanofastidiosa archaeon]|nr:radical SAM protein [Candidatus Methanofastidiosa archaeon]